jgi:hypothetical protein
VENELQGGDKRYTHRTYGLVAGSLIDYNPAKMHFYKKSWVPMWFWNLFSTPDYVDLVDAAMKRADEQRKERVAASLFALCQESPIKLSVEEWKKIMEDEL